MSIESELLAKKKINFIPRLIDQMQDEQLCVLCGRNPIGLHGNRLCEACEEVIKNELIQNGQR